MINFTNRDYDTIKADLINQLKSMTDKWNDDNESDASMLFINTLAGISAMLNFYIDKQSNESYINLAKEDKNVISLLELLNYKRPLRVPSRSTQVFEILSNEASDAGSNSVTRIEFPKYTSLLSGDGEVSYILGESVVITKSDSYKEALILQGSRESYNYIKDNIDGYKLYLPQGGITEEDFIFTVDNVNWLKCDNAFLKYQGGRYYSLHRDAYDSHYILLSCDYENYISENSVIYVEYTNTLGEHNAPPNTVLNIPSKDYSNTLKTYNKDYFTGGFTDNDIYLDRAKVQANCKLLDKLVRLEDYEAYIDSYPGVVDSQCVDWSVRGFRDIKPYQILCYLLLDNEEVSPEFLDKLSKDLKERQVYSNEIILKPGIKVSKNVTVKITPKSKFVDTLALSNLVKESIYSLYKNRSFDKNLVREDIYSVIFSRTNEIFTLNIIEPSENYFPSIGEYFVIDKVEVEVE